VAHLGCGNDIYPVYQTGAWQVDRPSDKRDVCPQAGGGLGERKPHFTAAPVAQKSHRIQTLLGWARCDQNPLAGPRTPAGCSDQCVYQDRWVGQAPWTNFLTCQLATVRWYNVVSIPTLKISQISGYGRIAQHLGVHGWSDHHWGRGCTQQRCQQIVAQSMGYPGDKVCACRCDQYCVWPARKFYVTDVLLESGVEEIHVHWVTGYSLKAQPSDKSFC